MREQQIDPIPGGAPSEGSGQAGTGAVGERTGGQWIVGQVRGIQHRLQPLPEMLLDDAQRDVAAIGAAIDLIGRGAAGVEIVAAPRLAPGEQPLTCVRRHPGHHAVGHRHIHHLAAAGDAPADQRGHDAVHRHQRAATDIGDQRSGHERSGVRPREKLHRAHDAKVVHVVSRPQTIRPVLTEAGQGAIHQARIALRQLVVAQAEAVHDAGTEALDDHIRPVGQTAHRLQPLGVLEVQGDAALVAVAQQEAGGIAHVFRRQVALIVARAGLLDLDHLGAEAGQHLRRQRAGQQAAEFQDGDALQRVGHSYSASDGPGTECRHADGQGQVRRRR